MKSKSTAILLAIFLGGIGIHRFYLRQIGLGILYLIFCVTLIPAIVALIDAIVWITWKDEQWDLKYNPVAQVKSVASSNAYQPVVDVKKLDDETAEYVKMGRCTHFYPSLAGFQYHDAPKLIGHLKPGTNLLLVPEPDNKYHANAIKVMFIDNVLGYLPKEYANSFAPQIARGDVIEARIFNYVPELDDYDKVAFELIDVSFFQKVGSIIKAR